jgi:bacillithiol system protein YtxJ
MFGISRNIPDDWNILEDLSGFERLMDASEHCIQFIFKHSTRCGISSAAKNRISALPEGFFGDGEGQPELHYVDVIGNRQLSNLIAAELSVMHHSPQLIALSDRKVIWHGSHSEVRREKIEELLADQNPAL